eukprot:6781047-Alexandrium_andersonii.AAC.1
MTSVDEQHDTTAKSVCAPYDPDSCRQRQDPNKHDANNMLLLEGFWLCQNDHDIIINTNATNTSGQHKQ